MKTRWKQLTLVGLGSVFAVTVAFTTAPAIFAQDQAQPQAPAPQSSRQGHRAGGLGGLMGFGLRGQSLATLATALKLTEANLQSALDSGKSVADIAAEQQVALNTVIEALIAEQRTALAQAVIAGRLTQAQVDAVLANQRENLPEILSLKSVPASLDLPIGGFGGHSGARGEMRGGGMSLATIATTLKITEADLLTALQGGKSVADVATEKGVTLDTVVNAVVAEQTAKLKQAVTAGRLTQAQADEQLAAFKTRLTEQLQTKGLPVRMGPGSRNRGEQGTTPGQAPSQQAPSQPAPTPTPAPSSSSLST